jgi:hypothetical protein
MDSRNVPFKMAWDDIIVTPPQRLLTPFLPGVFALGCSATATLFKRNGPRFVLRPLKLASHPSRDWGCRKPIPLGMLGTRHET